MDDDLDLWRDPGGDGGAGGGAGGGRPWGLLTGALVAVLVAMAGLVWAVGSLTGGDADVVPAAASPGVTTVAPSTTPAAPTTTAGTPSPAPSTTAAPAPPLPRLSPTTPRATPAPTRATPTRRPTLSPRPAPVGVAVPDVVGLRVPVATLVLRSAGFRVAVPGGAVVPAPDQRRVRAQTPAAGTRAPAGSTVTLLLDSS